MVNWYRTKGRYIQQVVIGVVVFTRKTEEVERS